MSKNTIRTWLRTALLQAVRAAAQTAVATIGSAAVLSHVDWMLVLSASAMAAVLSILTSLAGLPQFKKIEEKEV